MAHKLIGSFGRLTVTGVQVFGRAAGQALKAAALAAKSNGNGNGGGRSNNSISRNVPTGISLEEACKILDVNPKKVSIVEAEKKYDHLFKLNDKEKGGSPYIQAKVFRAFERIEAEFPENLRGKDKTPKNEKETESKGDL